MLPKLFVSGLLLIAALHAQPPAEALAKFYASVDDALGAHPGAVIADIGTGQTIAHPLRIAEKVGASGRVVCVDVEPSIVTKIKERVEARHASNIEAVLGKEDDPLLAPGTFDAILISNTYHEFTQPSTMLKHISEALKPGGRLVVVELYSGAHRSDTRAEQAKRHDLSPDILEQEALAAGFVVKERIAPLPIDTDRFKYWLCFERAK
jgi:ubiquinone/menaquinone biosynthesis C-methylase UbiE